MVKRGGVRDSVSLNFSSNHINSKKSQAAVEFIIILAFVMIILLAVIAVNQNLMTSISNQLNANKAKIALNDLGDAAQQVYQQGVGAQTRVFVTIPKGILSTQVNDQTISISLGTPTNRRDVYKNLNFHVVGSIPSGEGNQWITVKSRPGYVIIGFTLIEVTPSGFSKTMLPSNITTDYLYLRNAVDENIDVALSYSGDDAINVSLTQTNFLLTQDGSANTSIIFSASTSAQPGVYTGVIQVDANTTTESQSIFVPVVVTIATQSYGECPLILLFPEKWDAGIITEDRLLSKDFLVCSEFLTTQNVDLDFSNSTYFGFDSYITSKTLSIDVAPGTCNTTTVYLNTTGAALGNYTVILTADTGAYSDSSTILYSIDIDGEGPDINLMFPEDNYTLSQGSLIFYYNATDYKSNIASCSLVINDTIRAVDSSVTEGIEQSFTLVGLGNGYFMWSVNCTDDSPVANGASSEFRNVFINLTSLYATAELAFEEDYDPQWTSEIQTINDSSYAIAIDESNPNYPPADYVEFDFPDLGISSEYAIDSVVFTMRHYADMKGGWFDDDERHRFECYDGSSWIPIEVWLESNLSWAYYSSPDLSGCISTPALANNIHVRVEYDPADDIGGELYIDWAQIEVNITTMESPNLWELIVDDPLPLDYSSGLNTTANTFGRTAGDDGWDWDEDPYGGTLSSAEFNIDPNMNGATGDSTVASDNRIEVRVGGGAPGAPSNADDSSFSGPAASGAYGVAFNITPGLYSKISSGRAQLLFDWYADQDAGWGNGLDSGDEAWIKARLITPSTTIWLGSDQDSWDNDADSSNDIWFRDNPVDDSGSENFDITSYITTDGIYYIDFGAAVGDWDYAGEGFGAYFDNIIIVITE